MTRGIETRLDGETLVVRFPMRFQRRGGRKRIVAPDGSAIVPTSKPQPDGTLVKALAPAWRWQRMLESGDHGTLAELAAAERISRSYICRVLRLTLLAPDIVERILDGLPTPGLAQFLKPFPVEWERQCGNASGSLRAALNRPESGQNSIGLYIGKRDRRASLQANHRAGAPLEPVSIDGGQKRGEHDHRPTRDPRQRLCSLRPDRGRLRLPDPCQARTVLGMHHP
jgi:hypothetical protein